MIAARARSVAAVQDGRVTLTRWLVVAGSGLVVAAATFPFTSKPVHWDEWVYMGLAFHPQPRAWVLNRYAHIYALKPFMWVAGDPYVGARLYWSASLGVMVAALVWVSLHLPRDRGRVLALTLLLLFGQPILFETPGIPYADYTVMVLTTVACLFVVARIVTGTDFSRADAIMLGAVFFVGLKAKETALPMLALGAAVLITPAGRLRDRRDSRRLIIGWLIGMGGALLGLMAIDALMLNDPFFSLRPSSWWRVLSYNAQPYEVEPGGPGWLGLMLQPSNGVSFALYLTAGIVWAARQRDPRLLVVYALPALFLLHLAALGWFIVVPVNARYVAPILPMMSFFASFAFVRVLRLYAVPRLATAGAVLAIAAGTASPLVGVIRDLSARTVQQRGAARFAGFYEVARAVAAHPREVVFVAESLYGGAIRPGVLPAVTRMNFNVPFRSRPIVSPWPPPPQADYAIVGYADYQRWAASPDADPVRAVVSADREIALICLRAACRRR